MQADRVVPALDKAEAGHSCLGLGCEPATVEQLAFERREEALAHGVVVGVPPLAFHPLRGWNLGQLRPPTPWTAARPLPCSASQTPETYIARFQPVVATPA